jgi:Outer membrane protein beta-barrel domain
MKYIVRILALVTICCAVGFAQDTPNIEIFGGYSYLNSSDGDDLNGWSSSVVKNVNHWFGIKGEVSGFYQSYTDLAGDKLSVSNHYILGGGQFTYRKNEKFQPFAHLMAGTVLLRAKVDGAAGSQSAATTGFVFMMGGGADYKIAKALAVRLIQADYLIIREGGFNSRGLRLSTGLVYRHGSQ